MAKLVFYYGSMNSSKSAQLLMTAFNFKQQGKTFEIVKSSHDTRDTTIKSRALSIEMECTPITHFVELMQIATLRKPDWLFVDEVQFMDEEMINTLAILVDEYDINVICYGLLTDFQGQLFEGSKCLVQTADSIREIKNQCIYCDNKANRNMRFASGNPIFEGETIMVGAEETYASVCRKCYNKARYGSR